MTAVWEKKKLRDICGIERGGSPRPIQSFITNAPDGINWIKISDATASGKYIYTTKEKIKPEGASRSRMVYEGDFLLSNSMSFGRPYIMKTSGCIHDGWLVLRQPKANSDFLYYVLSSSYVFEQFDQLASGSTVRNLNIALAGSVEIPLPSEEEQQRIVAILDAAFAEIETAKANAETNLQNARDLFESYLNQVFTKCGEQWISTTLAKATGGVFTGPFGSLLHKSDYVANGIPLVNPAHITDIGVEPDMHKTVSADTAERLSNYIMHKSDVVIGRRGEMGRCALVTDREDGWLCGTGSFFIKNSPLIDSGYLVRLLRSNTYKQRLERIAGGAVMPNLSNIDLGNLSLDIPPLEEQKKILKEIEEFQEQTKCLEKAFAKKLSSLEELKKSLLHQAFSGSL